MSKQTLAYIQEMKDMYLTIMKKCDNDGVLTELDMLFLKTYKRTIGEGV